MVSKKRVLRALGLLGKIQLLMLIAASFYAVGFISGRSEYKPTGVVARLSNISAEEDAFVEQLIDVDGAINEEERCARTFALKYRELCRETMLGYVISSCSPQPAVILLFQHSSTQNAVHTATTQPI